MTNAENTLYVREKLNQKNEDRKERIHHQQQMEAENQQKEAERREDLLEAMFLEQLSNKTRINRMMSELSQAQTIQQPPRRRPTSSESRRREEEAEMRTFQRRTKMGYSVIGHVIIVIVLSLALKDGLVSQELITPFSCCVCLIFGFDGGRIWNEILHFFNDPARKTGDL